MEKLTIGNIYQTGFYPPIINYFKGVDESLLFNSKYNFRHPGAIFNITSLYLTQSLTEFIGKINDVEADYDSIFNGYRLVIYDFFKFYDSCFEVIACFCDIQSELRDFDFVDRWLENNGYKVEISGFKNSIKDDISVLKNTYNKLKHTSNRLAWLNTIYNNGECLGYYLEKRITGESAGNANENFYPISLNRDLRNIYYLIFKISSQLQEVLFLINEKNNPTLKDVFVKTMENDDNWVELNNQILNLQPVYFPNEIGKSLFIPSLEKDYLIFVKEEIKEENVLPKAIIKISYKTGGDGFTKAFSMPHLGLDLNLDTLHQQGL